jgi:hypothetical protein
MAQKCIKRLYIKVQYDALAVDANAKFAVVCRVDASVNKQVLEVP